MRRTTRRHHSLESALVEAAFTVADDLRHRVFLGTVRATLLLWTACQVLVGIVRDTALDVWLYANPSDRAAITAGARAACRGTVALVLALPCWTATAAVWLWTLVRWADHQSGRAVAWLIDTVESEVPRWERRLRGRVRLEQVPQPEEDEYDDLYTEYGDPVGTERRAA